MEGENRRFSSIDISSVKGFIQPMAGMLASQTWAFFFVGLLMVGAGYLLPRARQLPVAQKIRDLKIAS